MFRKKSSANPKSTDILGNVESSDEAKQSIKMVAVTPAVDSLFSTSFRLTFGTFFSITSRFMASESSVGSVKSYR